MLLLGRAVHKLVVHTAHPKHTGPLYVSKVLNSIVEFAVP